MVVLVALAAASPASALRIVDYNLTNYPSVLFPARQPYFRVIFSQPTPSIPALAPDVVAVEEMISQAGVDSFLTNVLNVVEPGQWASTPFVNGNDTDNMLYYKPASVQFLGMWTFYPNPANHLRLVNVYRLKPVGYSDASAEFRVYITHLKASTGSTNEAQRLAEATGIRDSMNAMPPGTAAILCGDFNIYSGAEGAFTKLLESQTVNIGRLYDPLNATLSNWNSNPALGPIDTQCPCLTCPTGSGFSGGGLDDRFDMFLASYPFNDGQGLEFIASTYQSVGNDSSHFNGNITDAPVIPEGATFANALWNASDHLPIRVDLRLPARIALGPGPLAFGSVIVGGPAPRNVTVANPAIPPAQDLAYSLAASAGFSAPAGSFVVAAGSTPASHEVDMSTAAPGAMSGTLAVTSNDADQPVTSLALSGTVLDHAEASLDASDPVTTGTLDFGTQAAGSFTPLAVQVHDRGWNALKARLAITGATITGGDGRFSVAGGFHPALAGESPASFPIQFDDAGANTDVPYTATLEFTTADEPLPGAAAQAALTVNLSAQVSSGTTDAPPALPTVLRFYPPRPNPMGREAWFAFDLPRPAPARLEIFDLSGRRVALLAEGEHAAGHVQLRWDGTDDAGVPLQAGLYFARFETPGLRRVERIARLR
ncbi:MAG TPA: choice-of-anchor D domain-containing protein [Candidatus Eisenbacteria bacterium]